MKFELIDKLQILREGETNGIEVTCRKWQISRSLFYNWKHYCPIKILRGEFSPSLIFFPTLTVYNYKIMIFRYMHF